MLNSRRLLQPSVIAMGTGHLGTDTRPEDPSAIEAMAPFLATALSNSGGDLAAIKEDVLLLLAEDHEAIVAFDEACGFEWMCWPAELAALKLVLEECLRALDFRISFHHDLPTDG